MAICKTTTIASYLDLLRNDKAEQGALFQDMLIPVTSFFRDTEAFKSLSKTIIPPFIKNITAADKSGKNNSIRVWVAGCSTGEEAYSIAICLHECCAENLSHIRIQIFASDISEKAIKKARVGIYSKADVKSLSAERLRIYFVKTNSGYEVSKFIRDMCVFALHNFLQDPPFAKMDLISCRNSLIYMDAFLQKKALTTFHYALKENGILLLGKSETTGGASDFFSPVNKIQKIYSRKSIPGCFMHVTTERSEKALIVRNTKATKIVPTADFRKSAEDMLLSEYTPAGVVVNNQLDIVHIHGAMSAFLEQSPGTPTFNLLKMVKEGLSFELRNALHKAKTTKKVFVREFIPVTMKGKESLVSLRVIPLQNTIEPFFLSCSQKLLRLLRKKKGSRNYLLHSRK